MSTTDSSRQEIVTYVANANGSLFSLDHFLGAKRNFANPAGKILGKNKSSDAYKAHWLKHSSLNAWYDFLKGKTANLEDGALFDESLRIIGCGDESIAFKRESLKANYGVTFSDKNE
jgi:hypothetical protein